MKFVMNELNLVAVSNIRIRVVFSTILKKMYKMYSGLDHLWL